MMGEWQPISEFDPDGKHYNRAVITNAGIAEFCNGKWVLVDAHGNEIKRNEYQTFSANEGLMNQCEVQVFMELPPLPSGIESIDRDWEDFSYE